MQSLPRQIAQLLSVLLFSAAFPPCASADVSAEMPDAQAVIAGIHGTDDMDTAARRQAAMSIMTAVLNALSIERATQRGERSPGLPAKAGGYRRAAEQALSGLDEKYRQKCRDWDFACPKDRLYTRMREYSDSEDFRRELLSRHLSPELMKSAAVKAYLNGPAAVKGARQARNQGAFHAATQPLRFLGLLASFSLWWLLPAVVLFIWRAVDHEETEALHASSVAYTPGGPVSVDHTIWRKTGRIIEGDASQALALAFFWSIAFPIGYAYFPILADASANVWIWKVLVPIVLLIMVVVLAIQLVEPEHRFWRVLRLGWIVVLGLSAVNLSAWLVWLLVR